MTYKNAREHTFTHIHTNTQTHITDLLCVSCIRNKLNHPHRLLTKFALLQLLLQVLQGKFCFSLLENIALNACKTTFATTTAAAVVHSLEVSPQHQRRSVVSCYYYIRLIPLHFQRK